MKKGLIGCVNNVLTNIDKIKVWSNSFKEVSKGDVCLVVLNPTLNELNLLHTMGITTAPYWLELDETVNNVRLKYQIQTLEKLDWDYALVTDVFDVMFQNDPFSTITLKGWDLTIGTEGIYHSEEPWNLDVMQKSYPDKVELVRNELIYCSGVMGGKRDKLVELLKEMETITMSGEKGHDIRDQAALNIILNEQPLWKIQLLNPKSNWVLHCAVGGPTDFYEAWGFKRHYQERWGEAQEVNGVIINGQGKMFDIVHQFNRIPDWNQKLTERYVK